MYSGNSTLQYSCRGQILFFTFFTILLFSLHRHTLLREKDAPIKSVESETYHSSISPVFNQKATSACCFFCCICPEM